MPSPYLERPKRELRTLEIGPEKLIKILCDHAKTAANAKPVEIDGKHEFHLSWGGSDQGPFVVISWLEEPSDDA